MNKLPIARSSDVVIQQTGKEVLIYDLKTDKAFCLNETSAIVFQACNGKTGFDELKVKSNFADDIIFLALDGFKQMNLLEKSEEFISPLNNVSRREAVQKIGLASVIALPVIASLVAPVAAQTQSCLQNGASCTTGGVPCCSGLCEGTCI